MNKDLKYILLLRHILQKCFVDDYERLCDISYNVRITKMLCLLIHLPTVLPPVDDTASGTANIANSTHSGTLTAVTADVYGHGRSAEVLGGFTGICRACVRDEPVFWARLYRRLHIGRTELAEAARRAGLAPNGDVHTGLHGNDSISTTTTTTSSSSEAPSSASVSDEGGLELA